MSTDATLESTLNTALREISQRCDFVHAETLRPAGDACMVQGGSNFSADQHANNFHRASLNFQFPQYACVPGRVWKTMKCEWHQDVSLLPAAVFSRAEIAKISMLKACLALPLCRQGHLISVVLFFSRSSIPYDQRLENTIINLANDILAEVCTRTGHAQLQFVSNGPAGPSKKSQTGTSKIWESAKVALSLSMEQRSKDDIENIIKFSKRLPFFKYVVNACRESLCKDMRLMVLEKGEQPIKGKQDRDFVWFIVVKGRVDMLVRTEKNGKQYPLRVFEDGETFAHSYLSLLTGGREDIQGELVAAEAGTHVVRVEVLQEHRGDFKSLTKPLLFEELAKYFDVSADEAAEKLGVCMSAIKKICRRHGIIRWPHRKLLSANKALCLLDNKMQDPQDAGNLEALRSEAINILVSKLRVVLNPTYIINSELVQLLPMDGQGVSGVGMMSDDEGDEDEMGVEKKPSKAGKADHASVARAPPMQDKAGQHEQKKTKTKDAHAGTASQAAAEQSSTMVAGVAVDEVAKVLLDRIKHVPMHQREQVLQAIMDATRLATGLGVGMRMNLNGVPQQSMLGAHALAPGGLGLSMPGQHRQPGYEIYRGSNTDPLAYMQHVRSQNSQVQVQPLQQQHQQMQQNQAQAGRPWGGQHEVVHHDGGVDELLDSDSSDEEDQETTHWGGQGQFQPGQQGAQQTGATSVLSRGPDVLAGLLRPSMPHGHPLMHGLSLPAGPLQAPLMGIPRFSNLASGLGGADGRVNLPNGHGVGAGPHVAALPGSIDQRGHQNYLQGQVANIHLLCDLLGGGAETSGVMGPTLQPPNKPQQSNQPQQGLPPPQQQQKQQQQNPGQKKQQQQKQVPKQQNKAPNGAGGMKRSAQEAFGGQQT